MNNLSGAAARARWARPTGRVRTAVLVTGAATRAATRIAAPAPNIGPAFVIPGAAATAAAAPQVG